MHIVFASLRRVADGKTDLSDCQSVQLTEFPLGTDWLANKSGSSLADGSGN